jgi:hypothetical protein
MNLGICYILFLQLLNKWNMQPTFSQKDGLTTALVGMAETKEERVFMALIGTEDALTYKLAIAKGYEEEANSGTCLQDKEAKTPSKILWKVIKFRKI